MNNSPKIKFCGLKKIEDVELALKLNIDYVGFIYVKNTPRYISFENSKNIINKFNKKINFIGVFLNHSDDYIEKGVKCGINLIQLHGNETPTRCKEIRNNFNLPIIKAIPIFKQKDILEAEKYNDYCDMFLFDTKTNGENKYNDKLDYWVSEKDEGIYDAFNKGMELSRGEYIGIIDKVSEYRLNSFILIFLN